MAAGIASSAAGKPGFSPAVPKPAMHVGAQGFGISRRELEFLARHGVEHLDGPTFDWNKEEILKGRETCASFGVSLDMVHVDIGRNVTLGKSPERDREIDILCDRIRIASEAGLRGLNYNFLILPHFRTKGTPGRGGVTYSSWDITQYTDTSLTEAGRVTLDEAFERIEYFLTRVIPVAEEYRIQMASHLPDPPTPPGFRGVDRWNYTIDGLKRFASIVDSPYHGFNLCCGTLAEGLEHPGRDIYDIVRYFGERKKIFNVHFRNIRGGLNKFQEVYPDEGDIDMYRLMKVFRDVGYPYMLMPDHAPSHPDEEGLGRARPAWAFQFGYIKALIQAAIAEG